MAYHSAEPAEPDPDLADTANDPDDAGADDRAPRRAPRLLGGLFRHRGDAMTLDRCCPQCGYPLAANADDDAPSPPPRDAVLAPSLWRFERKTVWNVGDPEPMFKPTFTDRYGRPFRYDRDLCYSICETADGRLLGRARDYYELVYRFGPLTI